MQALGATREIRTKNMIRQVLTVNTQISIELQEEKAKNLLLAFLHKCSIATDFKYWTHDFLSNINRINK